MADRFSFSAEILRFEEVAVSHADTANSIRYYYRAPCIESLDPKFVGYSLSELERERDQRLEDLDKNSTFNVLAALEADFRTDFLLRCGRRKKDSLSRAFRGLYKMNKEWVSLEDDIFECWKKLVPGANSLISALKGAFRYRHWLAHGRYWIPKLGRSYDFYQVCLLAREVESTLQLESRD